VYGVGTVRIGMVLVQDKHCTRRPKVQNWIAFSLLHYNIVKFIDLRLLYYGHPM